MQLYFRVFFKKESSIKFMPVKHIIEYKAADFKEAYNKAKKMSKGKKLRIVMIAEIPKLSDLPESL